MAEQTEHADHLQEPQAATGEVYRRRYTRYTGSREGRTRSYSAIILHSVRRALGVRRKWTAKILPIILYSAAFIPVIGFISIPALFGTGVIEFDGANVFSTISLILLVFAAAASPEMLCDDRRENVLPLYHSRGLSRWDYLAAKLIALGGLMLSVSLLPALLLFIGNTFLDDQPFSYLRENYAEVLRIIGTAVTLSVYFAAIGLAISALTERKGVASAIYIGFFLAGSAITSALYFAIDQGWAVLFGLAAPFDIPDGLVYFFFEGAPDQPAPIQEGYDPAWFLVSAGAYVLISAVLLYRRYLRED